MKEGLLAADEQYAGEDSQGTASPHAKPEAFTYSGKTVHAQFEVIHHMIRKQIWSTVR